MRVFEFYSQERGAARNFLARREFDGESGGTPTKAKGWLSTLVPLERAQPEQPAANYEERRGHGAFGVPWTGVCGISGA